ncbi:MAG TPA: radical SAM protein [Candidatus Wallbacteria bacterium]|nr:radical SAM protein [Candidatus Wallbacteria bacterium]
MIIKFNKNLRPKIKKVLLISPHGKITITSEGSRERKLAIPSLGLAYLASSLAGKGFEVEILDVLIEGFDNEMAVDGNTILYGLTDSEIKRRIIESKPDMVGVSCIISNRSREVAAICRLAKEAFPDIHVVAGGQHPTGMPEMILNENIDYILRGEADNSIIKLVETINFDGNLAEVNGIVLKNGRDIYINPVLDFPDFKSLGDPAWHLFKLEKYWDAGMCDYEVGSDGGDKKFMVVITSRGCPHNCYFCTSAFMSGRKFRAREIKDVIREIKGYKEKYNLNRIYFWDDNFFINKARVKEFLNSLIDNFTGITFEITSGSEVNSLDDEIIELLAKAGFKKIFLAVESPNEEVQKEHIDKKVNISKVPQLVKKIHECAMLAEGSFMVGFPGETKAHIDKTLDLVKTFGFDRISISIVNPLPGTDLYRHCLENNLLFEDFDPQNIRWSQENIKMPDVERGYIARRRREVWLEYMKDKINVSDYEQEKQKK